MKCNKCKDPLVFIKKTQSNKEKRDDKNIAFAVCKTCDPIFASLGLLDDGFIIACNMFKQKNQKDD